MILEWRDDDALPRALRIEETGEVLVLPAQPVISIGRQGANDLTLRLPDSAALLRVSRVRHLELRRAADELYVHPLSHHEVEVDGQVVPRGERARAVGGTVVRLAGAATLTFLADPSADRSTDEAQLQTIAVLPPSET
jgi:hypothetical protein